MSSGESDDEPLSVLAANKKLDPKKYIDERLIEIEDTAVVKKRKKKKIFVPEQLSLSINLRRANNGRSPAVIQRPEDVWLYMKELNTTGPYSCLLCPEWFINRSKLVLHYVLNHKKDFCGICRYFVPDREAWLGHVKFHTPWPCSQCVEDFETEGELRLHLSSVHELVHCRLCHFRVPEGDQYNTHLFQKHNVTNVTSKNEETLWELDYEGCPNFLCLLCSKSSNLTKNFFSHYMGFHHFTLKCFNNIISGKDPPFIIQGADLRSQFVHDQLQEHVRVGYVGFEPKPNMVYDQQESENTDSKELLKALIPEIKQETISGDEIKCDDQDDNEHKPKDEPKDEPRDEDDPYKNYDGDEDFDVTLMELIVLQKCYFDYVKQTLKDINSNIVPQISDITYDKAITEDKTDIICSLCKVHCDTAQNFTNHMTKLHSVKSVPIFSCRVCATPFNTHNELETHATQELGDFEDLWICQFCDKEFDNRGATRRHLTQHFETLEYENCFSPHLGFKCRYCPTLFWNETDRETHQVVAHFSKHTEDYYKCKECNDMFSDKVWFIHHYLEKHTSEGESPLYLLKCCLCCLVLPTVEEMRTHFNSNHPEAKKVFCSLETCNYRPLSHRKSFKLHVRTIHHPRSRPAGAVRCTFCAREFSGVRACSAHMAQMHGTGKFKCKLCGEQMQSGDERKLHYMIRHPGQHPFSCSVCGKSFLYKSTLYMHKQEHQPNKDIYKCQHCSKIFQKRDSYREHILIHEGPRHACSYCPMRFVQRSNMLRHERRHTGERPYACPHCPRSFSDKGACNAHIRTHSKRQTYSCMYCGQTFVQKSKLTYHIRKHTGENLETCTVCSKLFTSMCSLREHMKTHNAKKVAVNCPLCDKKYQDERYMLRHLRTSHTRAQFICPLCSKAFTSAADLRNHVLTHSKHKPYRCKICPKNYAVKRTLVKHLRRRHGIKGTEDNIKGYYTGLQPRECGIALSEEVMTSIFGPPKKMRADDLLISDYVTLKNQNITYADQKDQEEEKSDSEDEKSKESDKDSDSEGNRPIKVEKESEDESNLEPTDFVCVKIEPMDEQDE